MTQTTGGTKGKKTKGSKFDSLIGPTDAKVDAKAREILINARIGLLLKHAFFGNIATRLKLTNADSWCGTAATDGVHFFYNSRFICKLKNKEPEFLVGHEVLHVVYDHMGRRGSRDPQLWNIANDFAVNSDLRRHKIGDFITTIDILYDQKYDNWSSEEIFDDIMKNAKKMSLDDLIEKMLDEHMDDEGTGNEEKKDANGKPIPGSGRPTMTAEERERARQEMKQAILAAAQQAEAGTLPLGVERLVRKIVNPVMPWRELIQQNITSAVRSDYSFSRPSRRSWHMDAVMPGMIPGEEIDVDVAIDMSGSISESQAMEFLSEVVGMVECFDGFKLHIFCFDTEIYNPMDYTSENFDAVEDYKPAGGGGTDFDAIFNHLKEVDRVPKRLIVFTDGYPCGSWGDANYCDTTWIIHGDPNPNPPFGTFAIYDDHRRAS